MDIMVVLNQMIQLFLVMALGYLLYHIGLFDLQLNRKLTTFLINVTTPAMILASVLGDAPKQGISMILYVFIVAVLLYLCLPIISYVLVKVMRIPIKQQGLYMFMTTYSNIGFMGFPVMQAIFGSEAVFYTAIFNMIFNLSCFSMGIMIMNYGVGNKTKLRLKSVLTPGVIASIIALIIYIFDIHVPSILANTCSMVGNITTPIAMLLIGSTLATLEIKEVFNDFRIYPYALIKQLVIPALFYPVLAFLIRDAFVLGITFIILAMPVANSAVLFSTEYGGDVKLAAKLVFITTLLSVASIPLMVYLFLL